MEITKDGAPAEPDEAEKAAADKKCPTCGGPMMVKRGRTGRFLSCKAYPECKTALPLGIGIDCPEPGCDGGEVVERKSKKGRQFYGCSKYPDCAFVSWGKPRKKECPDCGGHFLVEKWTRDGKGTLACPKKGCKYKEDIEEE
jgi:DNA topoisomerase-1